MKKRLIEFLAYKDLGQNKFEEMCGIANGTVSNMRNNMTVKTLLKISAAFPDLNIDWLLAGKGTMLNNTQHMEGANKSVAIGRDATGNEIHIICQNVDEFIKITEKHQEHIDRLLSIIEKLTSK
jgi:hypothetical protein